MPPFGFLRQNVRVSTVASATKRISLSVGFTVGLYGIAFGAAGIAAGFSVFQTCILSLIAFTGASQFAAVGVIGAGGSALSAIATASLLGLRNTLYGAVMSPRLHVRGFKRIIAAQITIDESTGVALGQEINGEEEMRRGFWWTGAAVYLFWNLFTFLGARGAQALGDPMQWGLDAAVPAAFLGLLWPRLTGKRERTIALTSGLLALLLTPFLPAGLPIIATVSIALYFGLRRIK